MASTLAELANLTNCQIKGDHKKNICSVASIEKAGPTDIAYLSDKSYLKYLETTKAGALIINKDAAVHYNGNVLISDNPRLAFARIASILNAVNIFDTGIHQDAVIADNIKIPDHVYIGANAVLERDVLIDEDVYIGANTYIGEGVNIGAHTRIFPGVNIYPGTEVGKHCIIHSGAVIGSDGFGFAASEQGWVKVPQLGTVRIGNDVEIGANTTIDRGTLDDTTIGNGVKLDNLIQVAHNVSIGENTVIAACVGIAGSAAIGKNCTIGGQAVILGHLQIADDVHITATTLVSESITRPGKYSSSLPAQESSLWNRNLARLRKLDQFFRKSRSKNKF